MDNPYASKIQQHPTQATEQMGPLERRLYGYAWLGLWLYLAAYALRWLWLYFTGAFIATLLISCLSAALNAAEHPVAFLAYTPPVPWKDMTGNGIFPTVSVWNPYLLHAGTDLLAIEPDGTERTLVKGQDAGGLLAVIDFCVSLDGKSILYAHAAKQSGDPYNHCDIWRLDVASGHRSRITNARSEWQPPSGAVPIHADAGPRGVWNTSPCEVSGGRIVFTSNRGGVRAPKTSYPAMQLYAMDGDGANVEKIGHLNLGGAAHPTVLKNGRVIFSSGESQGSRTGEGFTWALWSINPDGTDWQPEVSYTGFQLQGIPNPFHFQTETSDGTIVYCNYYPTRSAYGGLLGIPVFVATPFNGPTHFGSPIRFDNPAVPDGWQAGKALGARWSYQRRGLYSLAPWTGGFDGTQTDAKGNSVGMLGHPMAGPENSLYCTWTGTKERWPPNPEGQTELGCYLIPDVKRPVPNPQSLVKVVDRPGRHEWMAAPIVPYSAIHGIDAPPISTGKKTPLLPPGSPYGLVGTSEIFAPEITLTGSLLSERIPFDPEEAEYIRFIYFNPTLKFNGDAQFQQYSKPGNDSQNGPLGLSFRNREGFAHYFNERTGILGHVPLKKWRTPSGDVHLGPNPPSGSTRIMAANGKPDSSFQAFIPADQPWSVQLVNAKGEAIYGTTAPTWHQVRPGEQRTDCRGCHQHWKPVNDIEFEQTLAASLEYSTRKLDHVELIEYERDIKPIEAASGLDILNAPSAGYESARADIDDSPLLTVAQARTVRKWIDTGKLRAWKNADGSLVTPEQMAGPYADANPPTLTVQCFADRTIIGACDPQSGLNPASLSVKSSALFGDKSAGTELAGVFTRQGDVWTAFFPAAGTLTASIRDNQTARNAAGEVISEEGNLTTIVRTVKGPLPPPPDLPDDPPPPPPTDPTIAELLLKIEKLEADKEAARGHLLKAAEALK